MEQETGVPVAGGVSDEAVQGTVAGMGEGPQLAPAAPAGDAAPPAGAPAAVVPGPEAVAAVAAAAPDAAPTPGVAPPAEADATGRGASGGPVASRRRFVKWLLGFSVVGTLALIAAPVVSFLVPPRRARRAAAGRSPQGLPWHTAGQGQGRRDAEQAGHRVNTDQAPRPSRRSARTSAASSPTTTRTGRRLPLPRREVNLQTGAVVGGPPPAPLAPESVSVENDTIYLVATS